MFFCIIGPQVLVMMEAFSGVCRNILVERGFGGGVKKCLEYLLRGDDSIFVKRMWNQYIYNLITTPIWSNPKTCGWASYYTVLGW